MARGRKVLSFEGLDEMRDTLTNLAPSQANSIARQTVYAVAQRVEAVLKRRIKKRSGKGEKSIKAVRRRGTPTEHVSEVRGGGTAPYLLMLEHGTSKTRAQPFIVPGTEEIRPDLPQIYREEFFNKLAKSLARRGRKK